MKEKHSREEYPSTEEKELHVVRNHKDTVFPCFDTAKQGKTVGTIQRTERNRL